MAYYSQCTPYCELLLRFRLPQYLSVAVPPPWEASDIERVAAGVDIDRVREQHSERDSTKRRRHHARDPRIESSLKQVGVGSKLWHVVVVGSK